jgi:hypothetical protein
MLRINTNNISIDNFVKKYNLIKEMHLILTKKHILFMSLDNENRVISLLVEGNNYQLHNILYSMIKNGDIILN